MIRFPNRIPLGIKLLYTAFLAVLIPVYLRDYGPTNFLYFCDIALLMTLVAVWTESSLWASAPLVGITVPQLVWIADFLSGAHLTGMTAYMFNSERLLFTRGLSLFHFWLPFLLLYIVYQVGFDRRAWITWSVIGCEVLMICYFFMPEPPAPTDNPNLPVNINYVFSMDDEGKQDIMDPRLWFYLQLHILTFLIWLPTAWVLGRFIRPPASPVPSA